MSNTSQPIDGSEGNYHDPYPKQSIEEVTAALAEAEAAVKASGKISPALQNGLHAAGKGPAATMTSIEWWGLRSLETALALSLRKKKAKAHGG